MNQILSAMPKVSVIIPVYKVEKYLPACLDSVRAQTFQDWEAICVNDGSPDNCGEILAEYAAKDPRIKVITQTNQGLSMARNNALKHAKGEYILFLDSDDFICPHLLEICVFLAEKEAAEMVSFNFTQDSEEISSLNPDLKTLKYIVTDEPLYFQTKRNKHKISVNIWSKLYKKELIEGLSFIPGIKMEDYPYMYAVLAKHPKSVILNLPLYHYEINPTSISRAPLTVKTIEDYQAGLNFVIDTYRLASQKEKRFVRHHLFPNILKQQFNKIAYSPKEKQSELYAAFAKELQELKERGWLKLWGHKITRYLKYKKIMKGDYR